MRSLPRECLLRKPFMSWKCILKRKHVLFDRGTYRAKTNQLQFMGVVCIVMLFIMSRTANFQYQQTKMESRLRPFSTQDAGAAARRSMLPRGLAEDWSDLELTPVWSSSRKKLKVDKPSFHNLLAIPVGIKQKHNVDAMVLKFLQQNFSVMLFHYDGNVDGWWELEWSRKAIHVVAINQTKWWFAKRFLHPSVVSMYDYIFLWDEDLGVVNFNTGRYLKIVRSEGLEISQPALDPNSTGIHHRITVRKRRKRFHRRFSDSRGSAKCSGSSEGPPCTGFVEGMAPVFSRSAWSCAWHLIQNDLVHGWGMDMKLGYCAQGDRTKKVGVIDSEYIVHQGIQTLGGQSAKASDSGESVKKRAVDMRSEIRRQSTSELQKFEERWEKAAKDDKSWVDPYKNSTQRRKFRHSTRQHSKV